MAREKEGEGCACAYVSLTLPPPPSLSLSLSPSLCVCMRPGEVAGGVDMPRLDQQRPSQQHLVPVLGLRVEG